MRGTALACCALAALSAAQEPGVSYVQFPGRSIQDVVVADADGDGGDDLVVSLRASEDSGREIVWCLRREGTPALRAPADRSLPLPRDVVAFIVADVDQNPGRELVLLSPSRVVAVIWPRDAERPAYRSLGSVDLLWQPPSPRYAFAFQEGVADLDGDGLDDLVLPQVGGFRAFVQRRGGDGQVTFEESELVLPSAVASDRQRNLARFEAQRGSGEIRFGDSGQPQFLVEITHEVGAPRLVDWNADERRDVVALVGSRLAVFMQQAEGRFEPTPTAVVELPERGMPLFDPSSFADCIDLDGDGRAEFVRASGRTEEDEVRSVLEIHRGQGGGSLAEEADERLLLQGFVSAPRFTDVDGDGVQDLVIGSLRTDLVDALAGGGSKAFDAQINVFLGRGGEDDALRFRRPVALVHRVQVPTDGLRAADRAMIEFVSDFDGDGLRDLFVRLGDGVLRVLPVTKRGRGFAVGDPIWSLATTPEARVSTRRTAAGAVILLEEADQVVVVEGFR
jgi:hypothetical protein